jgi:DNA-binding NarL/FixJ family response regulator
MELKNIELQSNIKNAEEQLNEIARRSNSLQLRMKMQTHSVTSDNEECEIAVLAAEENSCHNNQTDNGNTSTGQKYTDVLKLSKEGMDESEIARNLKIGKGEVRLILGLNKE